MTETDNELLSLDVMAECLELLCNQHGKKQTEIMNKAYHKGLKDLDEATVVDTMTTLLDDRYFPTPARIRELVTGVVVGADWHTIVAVASGAKKSAIISGISAMALVTATTTSGLGTESPSNANPSEKPSKVASALRKIAFCDDPFTLRAIRKDWIELVAVPPIGNALPPADVEITLTPKEAKIDHEYPADLDYKFQTAAMLRCIKEKGSVSAAWMPIIDRYPAARKAEVLEFIEASGFKTPALEASPLYRKYLSVGEAMREINESEINGIINSDRQDKAVSTNGDGSRTMTPAQQKIWG
jgi:hypothetical protein